MMCTLYTQLTISSRVVDNNNNIIKGGINHVCPLNSNITHHWITLVNNKALSVAMKTSIQRVASYSTCWSNSTYSYKGRGPYMHSSRWPYIVSAHITGDATITWVCMWVGDTGSGGSRAGSRIADRSEGWLNYAGPGWRVSTWLNVIHHTLTPHMMWLPQNANMHGRNTRERVHCLL